MLRSETAYREDPRPGIMRSSYRDGGVRLDAGVGHDYDRVFGCEGKGVRVEGKVERGDGSRIRPGGAQQPSADHRRVQAGADADHEDPPRRGQQGGRLLGLIPALREQALEIRWLALHGLVHLRIGRGHAHTVAPFAAGRRHTLARTMTSPASTSPAPSSFKGPNGSAKKIADSSPATIGTSRPNELALATPRRAMAKFQRMYAM